MNKIKRVSLFFRIIFQIIFVMVPLVLAMAWMHAPYPLKLASGMVSINSLPQSYREPHIYPQFMLPQAIMQHSFSWGDKVAGFAVSAIPMGIELFILYSLIQLFKLYEQGEIFSLAHVRYIRNIGYALLVGQVINPVYQFLLGIVLTWHNPPGHRFAAVRLDHTNIGIVLTAVLMILISWIVAEGCKLREEQQLTI